MAYLLLWFCPVSAWADIYKLSDELGVVHYTNVPNQGAYQRMVEMLEEEGPRNRAGAVPEKGNLAIYSDYVRQAASESGVDTALVHAVIAAESAYNPLAVSRVGAKGLMQLMPATARRYNVKDCYDPEDNIRGGTRYLKDLLMRFGNDVELAVAAYNSGEQAVIKHSRRIPPYVETQAYVPKVLRLYKKYKEIL